MTNQVEIYCSGCQRGVRPRKGFVLFHCPSCGLVFMPGHVEERESSKDWVASEESLAMAPGEICLVGQ